MALQPQAADPIVRADSSAKVVCRSDTVTRPELRSPSVDWCALSDPEASGEARVAFPGGVLALLASTATVTPVQSRRQQELHLLLPPGSNQVMIEKLQVKRTSWRWLFVRRDRPRGGRLRRLRLGRRTGGQRQDHVSPEIPGPKPEGANAVSVVPDPGGRQGSDGVGLWRPQSGAGSKAPPRLLPNAVRPY